MSEVWIVSAAAVSALAPDLAGLWQGLLAGRSGVAPVNSFDASPYYCHLAAEVPGLEPSRTGGRLASLLERASEDIGTVPVDAVLFGASLKGEMDLKQHFWDRHPTGSESDPGSLFDGLGPARRVADLFSLRDPGVNFNAACASSLVALAMAAENIARGRAEVALVWAAEIVSEFVFAGFASLKALTPDGCRPFDVNRNGLVLGEGAAFLLLMSAERARREGYQPLASCRGWGIANDASHLTAPERHGRGLLKACRRALKRAGLPPEKVAAVKAHGTGTIHNDAMELAAFAALFGCRRPPLFSVKGSVGHTLGAAGALETAIAVKALQSATLPPTVGLEDPEAGFRGQLSAASRDFSGANLLLTNSGFGGVNTALLLTAGEEP